MEIERRESSNGTLRLMYNCNFSVIQSPCLNHNNRYALTTTTHLSLYLDDDDDDDDDDDNYIFSPSAGQRRFPGGNAPASLSLLQLIDGASNQRLDDAASDSSARRSSHARRKLGRWRRWRRRNGSGGSDDDDDDHGGRSGSAAALEHSRRSLVGRPTKSRHHGRHAERDAARGIAFAISKQILKYRNVTFFFLFFFPGRISDSTLIILYFVSCIRMFIYDILSGY